LVPKIKQNQTPVKTKTFAKHDLIGFLSKFYPVATRLECGDEEGKKNLLTV
jgi:hypothetical protein